TDSGVVVPCRLPQKHARQVDADGTSVRPHRTNGQVWHGLPSDADAFGGNGSIAGRDTTGPAPAGVEEVA
ncbi:MAG: hypothetical protein WD278_01460, partial [Pirellulales bacterium]